MDVIFSALWFFLPAGVANVTPILAVKIPLLKRWSAPMDMGLHWHAERLLGSHKTWRGLVTGVVMGVVTVYFQQLVVSNVAFVRDLLQPIPGYALLPIIPLGLTLGAGALLGDALKSLFKRRLHIPSGKSWVPFDQIDYIIGASILSATVVVLPLPVYLTALILWLVIHIASTTIGYLLKLKDQPI